MSALHLEIFHEDAWGYLETHEVRPGEHGVVGFTRLCRWDDGWWVAGRRVGRERIRQTRGAERFTIRLAPPTRRVDREDLVYQGWMGNLAVGTVLAVVWMSQPLPIRSELVELSGCTMHIIFESEPLPERKGPPSYRPLEEARPARKADPGHGPKPPEADGHMKGIGGPPQDGAIAADPPDGHPLALQIETAVADRHDDLALCFRSTGGAAIRPSGMLMVNGMVRLSGQIDGVGIGRDDFGLPALNDCVERVFESIHVPRPPEAVSIHFPVRFST